MNFLINGTDITTALESGIDTPVAYNVLMSGATIEVQSDRPLTKLYFSLVSGHDGIVVGSYYDGSTYSVLALTRDTTANLTHSGWVEWTKPDDDAKDGSFYTYKFDLSDASADTASTVQFCGIVFSEDRDLNLEYPNISEYLPDGDTSFIRFHVAAREAIVQWFRAKGNFTTGLDGTKKNLTAFDFLDINEVEEASKFMTLAKIFSWLSDAADDKWYQKSKDFMNQGTNCLNVYYVSLDKNRDGIAESNETVISTILVIERG